MNSEAAQCRIKSILDELCVELGFCLPPDVQTRIIEESPYNIDALTEMLIRAEGLDPQADIFMSLYRDVRRRVAERIDKFQYHHPQ